MGVHIISSSQPVGVLLGLVRGLLGTGPFLLCWEGPALVLKESLGYTLAPLARVLVSLPLLGKLLVDFSDCQIERGKC